MRMKKTPIFLALAAMLLTSGNLYSQQPSNAFQEAVKLYENGAFGSARNIFEKLSDPLSKAYSVLCAVKGRDADYPERMSEFEEESPENVLSSQIHFAAGHNLFEDADYYGAATELYKVEESRIAPREIARFVFEKAYCAFAQNQYPYAKPNFERVVSMPLSVYTAPSQYALGYIAYSKSDFKEAEDWFAKSGKDRRFKALSDYYNMECRFMDKDYDFITENAPAMLDSIPAERRGRLARMISESFLVKGDNAKALEFFRQEERSLDRQNRSDLFHAGSVLYAVGDYAGAIENFSRMADRTDSIGQIANYDLGYSYIQTKDKVDAAVAFREASMSRFNPVIREDAAFNAAKLAFDLNGDTKPFEEYMLRYSSEKRAPQIYNYMAIAALNNRDYAGAIDNYSKIEELDDTQKGNYVKANYLRASQLIANGSWSDAIPLLRAAGFYYPKEDRFNQLSRYWLAEANYNSGNYQTAQTLWNDLYNTSALRGTKESAMIPYNLGYAFFSDKKYETAARWFDLYNSTGHADNRQDALVRRADCDFARHDYKAAIAAYQKAIADNDSPDNIYPYFQQALAYGLTGDRITKISILSKVKNASSEAPMYAEAMYELGRAYMESGRNGYAAETFETLRKSTADNTFAARALIGKGMAYRNMKNYDTALEQYKQVVSLLPGSEYSEEALLAISSIYQATGHPEKYLEYVENSGLSLGSNASEKEDIYFNTAEQVYLAGNYKQAVASLGKYLSDYPNGARRGDAYFYMADSYRLLGDKEKACDNYAEVGKYLESGSFAETAALNYASLSYELDRFTESYKGYDKLLGIARMDSNKSAAVMGKMKAAYAARMWDECTSAAAAVKALPGVTAAQKRDADFTAARAYLAMSERDKAFDLFKSLSDSAPATAEGAESTFMLAQNLYDSGKFDSMESLVYGFAGKCGDQSYWLARCYIILADSFLERGNAAQARATLVSIRDGYSASGPADDVPELVAARLSKLQ